MTEKDDKKKPAEKPISLAPLKFEEAVTDLLKVKSAKTDDPGEEKSGQ